MLLPVIITASKILAAVPSSNPISATQCASNQTYSPDLGQCLPNDPSSLAGSIYTVGLGIIGGVTLLFIIYGGYIVMTSQGNPTQVAKGKSYITYAVVGLLLAIFGYVFMEIIVKNVLHIPGF